MSSRLCYQAVPTNDELYSCISNYRTFNAQKDRCFHTLNGPKKSPIYFTDRMPHFQRIAKFAKVSELSLEKKLAH